MYRLVFTGASSVPRICVHEQDMPSNAQEAIKVAQRHVTQIGLALREQYWQADLWDCQTNELVAAWTFERRIEVLYRK